MIPAVVDGTFLPRHPRELLASVDFRPVPSIIGVDSDEYGWGIPLVRPGSKSLVTQTQMLGGGNSEILWDLETIHSILMTLLYFPAHGP